MSDRDFALAILDLMPQDDGWCDFVSNLHSKVHDRDAHALPIDPISFITSIRDEYWYRHKDDNQTTSHIFTPHFEAQKRSTTQKRTQPPDIVATASSPSNPTKRARGPDPDRANLRCSNTHCSSKTGHDTSECVTYKGAKEGQYSPWWRGPWNIHLLDSQRSHQP